MVEFHTGGYANEVRVIAERVLTECQLNEDEIPDMAREEVEANAYTMFYTGQEVVLAASKNEPDGEEVTALAGKSADWRAMRYMAALEAMFLDVMEYIEELIELGDEPQEPRGEEESKW